MIIAERDFSLVGLVEPERHSNGSIRAYEPQARFKHAATRKRHAYGNGSFCKFSFEDAPEDSGVFLVVRHNEVLYVGGADNLKTRLNQQLGHIAPSDRYVGGQPTNCRINQKMLELLQADDRVEIRFHRWEDRWQLKRQIVARREPPWNLQGKT